MDSIQNELFYTNVFVATAGISFPLAKLRKPIEEASASRRSSRLYRDRGP
jgi:hypothetical protein